MLGYRDCRQQRASLGRQHRQHRRCGAQAAATPALAAVVPPAAVAPVPAAACLVSSRPTAVTDNGNLMMGGNQRMKIKGERELGGTFVVAVVIAAAANHTESLPPKYNYLCVTSYIMYGCVLYNCSQPNTHRYTHTPTHNALLRFGSGLAFVLYCVFNKK